MNKYWNTKFIALVVIGTVFLTGMSGYALANHGGGKSCPMSGGGKCSAGGGGYQKGGGLDQMFCMKAHFILANQEELGLTDDKVAAIKALKVDTKKSLIKQNADIEIAAIDIKSALHQNPIDTAAVNKLIDQKYELKKAKAKTLVDALAKLKGMLTQDQYNKLKEIWGGKGKGKHHKSE